MDLRKLQITRRSSSLSNNRHLYYDAFNAPTLTISRSYVQRPVRHCTRGSQNDLRFTNLRESNLRQPKPTRSNKPGGVAGAVGECLVKRGRAFARSSSRAIFPVSDRSRSFGCTRALLSTFPAIEVAMAAWPYLPICVSSRHHSSLPSLLYSRSAFSCCRHSKQRYRPT